MNQAQLFAVPESQTGVRVPTRPGVARVLRPNRCQLIWEPRDLNATLPEDHLARTVWRFLERWDLSPFYASIKAVLDRPGRPTTDPRVLLAVWLLGTLEEVGSARRLARLCAEHDAYRWLCGGVPINYHMLADFRAAHPEALDDLLSQIVASLKAAGAVTSVEVAQDGMRVRASAGASSFRRRGRLETCLEEAQALVRRLAEQREHPDPRVNKRQQAARERAARERQSRVEAALAYLPELQAVKEAQRKRNALADRVKIGEPRASTTDPEARIMKMADGGFRPAYNVQLATDSAAGVIVGVAVTASGSDTGQAVPMVDQVERRTGQRPQTYLVDGGFAGRADVTALGQRGITVYAPVRAPRWRPEAERYQPRWGDSPEVVAWRQRMSTEEAKTILRRRPAIAEWANAQVSQHGIARFTVRGLLKATTITLLVVIAHNFLRWASLRA
jgi:transposase